LGCGHPALERLRDRFALGAETFKRQVYAIGREKGREIAGRRELKPRASFEALVKIAEKITGERLIKRRGSTVKPLVMWAGRKLCGLTLREIGKRLDGMDYNAVSMAMRRWEAKLKHSPSTAAIAKQLQEMCNVDSAEKPHRWGVYPVRREGFQPFAPYNPKFLRNCRAGMVIDLPAVFGGASALCHF